MAATQIDITKQITALKAKIKTIETQKSAEANAGKFENLDTLDDQITKLTNDLTLAQGLLQDAESNSKKVNKLEKNQSELDSLREQIRLQETKVQRAQVYMGVVIGRPEHSEAFATFKTERKVLEDLKSTLSKLTGTPQAAAPKQSTAAAASVTAKPVATVAPKPATVAPVASAAAKPAAGVEAPAVGGKGADVNIKRHGEALILSGPKNTAAAPAAIGAKPAAKGPTAQEVAELEKYEKLAATEKQRILKETADLLKPIQDFMNAHGNKMPGLKQIKLVLDQGAFPALDFRFENSQTAKVVFDLYDRNGAEPAYNENDRTSFRLKPALRTNLFEWMRVVTGLAGNAHERREIETATQVPKANAASAVLRRYAGTKSALGMTCYTILMTLPSLINYIDRDSVVVLKKELEEASRKLDSIKEHRESFEARQYEEAYIANDGNGWSKEQIDAQMPERIAIHYINGKDLFEYLEENLKLGQAAKAKPKH